MSSTSFLSTASAVAELGVFAALADDVLVSAQRALTAHQRELDVLKARCAAEIAHRSDPELGFQGLARKNGFVNTEAFLQSVTGSTKAEATKLVRVGELLGAGSVEPSPLGRAVDDGAIGVDSANAIRIGLGDAATDDAVAGLLREAVTLDADALVRRAREVRNELDADAIARAEKQRRDLRYFTATRRPDGMVTGSYALADEDGALLLAIYDQATGPKRVGPRFVDTDAANLATGELPDRALEDPRTRGQKAADMIAGLLRIAIDVPDSAILGLHRPAVRVLINADALARREGHGVIEGNPGHPISFSTIERHLCDTGVIGIVFDNNGNSLNIGRDQRLYTSKQKTLLTVRDGGCRFPGCDRPPSWTEAHHINYWHRDHGRTDIDDGILLCRLHHLLVHDNDWTITHTNGQYWLTPPPDIDPTLTPRLMPTKNPLMRELLAG
ncbi:MAG: endonuclease, partial [Microbacteriaceae bacterium]|nr:endonuclease [Microbacteriaceae bacterium]